MNSAFVVFCAGARVGGAGVSPAILHIGGGERNHRRDAGATKPRSLRKIRMGAESRVDFLRKIQVIAAKVKHLDRLVFRVAEALEIAFGAPRFARLADLAPVPDQLVGKQNPFFARDHLHQVLFDFLGIGIA